MPVWIQNIIVIAIAVGCGGLVLWQILRTLLTGKGRAGSCCAKGCEGVAKEQAARNAAPSPNRVVFFPAEMLVKKKKL